MRVLFTTQPGFGHFHPMTPLARCLKRAGHEVTFATAGRFCPIIEASGFRAIPCGLDWAESESTTIFPELVGLTGREATRVLSKMFTNEACRAMVPDLLDIMSDQRPDIIVRENVEYGGAIAGELAGLPYANFALGLYSPPAFIRANFGDALDDLRAHFGLAEDPDFEWLFRHCYLSAVPPSFQFVPLDDVPTAHAFRPIPPALADDALPEWVLRLPEQATVYATLGTVFNQRSDIFSAIIEGLRDQQVNLVVTVGHNLDPAQFGAQPSNVRIERFVPQSSLLPFCDVVVTHAGWNTMIGALSEGLPLLTIPMGADQPFNAARCADLGASITVKHREVTADSVREGVMTLLEEPSYRDSAKRLQAEIGAMAPIDGAVGVLTSLV